MSVLAPSTYSPVVDPRDLTSVPAGLRANDELHVPLTPRRGPRLRAPSWLRRLRDHHRLVASFCTSDHALLRWEARLEAAERHVAALSPAAAVTMDVPFYAFMTPAQRERAIARSLAAIARAWRHWEPVGVDVVPLVKGLDPRDWASQLDLAAGAGADRAAFYVREHRLENDDAPIRRFVKAARARGLRPLLLGYFPRSPLQGNVDAAALHHYVLARRRQVLDRAGRARPLAGGWYSDLLGRFLAPHRVADLVEHNFQRARGLLAAAAPLERFAEPTGTGS